MANLATVDVQKIKLVFKRFDTETFVGTRRIEECLQAFYTVENFRARTLLTKFSLYFVTTLATPNPNPNPNTNTNPNPNSNPKP